MKIAFPIQRWRIKKWNLQKMAMLDMMHSILSYFTKNRFLFWHQHFDLNWQTEIYHTHESPTQPPRLEKEILVYRLSSPTFPIFPIFLRNPCWFFHFSFSLLSDSEPFGWKSSQLLDRVSHRQNKNFWWVYITKWIKIQRICIKWTSSGQGEVSKTRIK